MAVFLSFSSKPRNYSYGKNTAIENTALLRYNKYWNFIKSRQKKEGIAMRKQLPVVPYGKVPVVFLVGNGVLRAFGGDSWDGFLERITTQNLDQEAINAIEKLPYPMKPVVLTGDHVSTQLREHAQEFLEQQTDPRVLDYLRRLCDLAPDAILTTNYTYELEQALCPALQIKVGRPSKYRQTAADGTITKQTEQLNQYFLMPTPEGDRYIWHIHGELAKPDTMILGHYYYCELTSAIHRHIPRFIGRYQASRRNQTDFVPESWVDYFMIGDVYTVGFGLGLSEMDLWWLINAKKRHGNPDSKLYFWDGEIDLGKRLLAQAYHVEVQEGPLKDQDYPRYYDHLLQQLQKQKIGHLSGKGGGLG